MNRRSFLQSIPASASVAALAQQAPRIQRIDIYHHTHTDVGYTDLPSVCRDMQRRFIDVALDRCLSDKRFLWTVEATLGLDDWWRATPQARRDQLVKMVDTGQMDVMALAFNQAPFQNAVEWDQNLRWLPEAVWRAVRPRAAMQNDVNGMPRAGAVRLLDRGVKHLLMGINADSGGPPFRRPSAFWWKMPDGRRMFVWLGEHYGTAYSYFEPERFIRQQPRWAQGEFRPPTSADVHRTDEASLRAAHKHLLGRLAKLEGEGYNYPTLILSYTNQWRYDNDPPYPELGAFIEAWNRLGLKPELRFVLATDAVMSMEREVGARVPEHTGEWTDWWANGDASGPREVAASRVAKRYLAAASAPVFGAMPKHVQPQVEALVKDLCLFDEHTWGANSSIAQPNSLFTIGQYTEKSLLAYKPMGHAEALLGRRAKEYADKLGEGLHVVNTSAAPYSGWVTFAQAALRQETASLKDAKTGQRVELQRRPGGQVRFWVEALAPQSAGSLRFSAAKHEDAPAAQAPSVMKDAAGWPASATWPGMKKPLFDGECGHFIAAQIVAPGNRSTIARLHATADAAKRDEMRKSWLRFVPATYGPVEASESAHTLAVAQPVQHARLVNAQRRLELWKREPRARLTLRFDRISSLDPEVLYVAFAMPVEGTMPVLSNGGMPFTPYTDQLPGSVRDYYAIDGHAHYPTAAGEWLWVTRDAPMVTVGGPHTLARRTDAPTDTHRMLGMVFDNCWHTNFVADSHGTMEFTFDLLWRDRMSAAGELAEAVVAEPVIVINAAAQEPPELERHLFRT